MLLMARLTLDAALVVNRHSRIRVGKHMTWNSDDIVAPKMLTKYTGYQRILRISIKHAPNYRMVNCTSKKNSKLKLKGGN